MMLPLLAFAACFGSLFCGHVTGYSANDFTLSSLYSGVSDYVNIWGIPSLTGFTVCLWMKTNTQQGSPFSYAVSAHDNELRLFYQPNFEMWIGNAKKQFSVSASDDNWHHICASWDNSGDWQFYKDGEMLDSGTGFKTGYTIQGGGSLVLGQEQDFLGGGFDASQSLEGMLANVNVWDRVLTLGEIVLVFDLSPSCLAGEGNVYKWADFIYGIKGNTAVVIPSPCVLPPFGRRR